MADHRIDLRNATSPEISDLFRTIGLPSLAVCLPAGVACAPGTTPLPAIPGPGLPAAAPTEAAGASPVGAVADLLGSPTGPRTTRAAELAAGTDVLAPDEPERRGWIESVARAIAEVLP